ncbi:MAG TPA: DUF2141 domain-containing protein [Gemmatimonadaceae bacterium]|nr:DUF2141 domain-containing protein [Gemmatimonadaceae bacterium]
MLSRLLALLLGTTSVVAAHTVPDTVGASGDGATVTVVVTGATTPGGIIGAALFAAADGFPDGTPTAALQHPHAAAVADTFVFHNVALGRYAVAVQHDLNANGRMDRTIVGAPKEPWGVSRGVRHTFRAPRFDEAAFDVAADVRIDVTVSR